MEKRLKIKSKNIYKLKVIKVLDSGLIVKQLNGKEGFIHISEVADQYITNIHDLFVVDEYVYGLLKKRDGEKFFFSLKDGHTLPRDIQKKHRVSETNGGYYSLMYNLKKFLNS